MLTISIILIELSSFFWSTIIFIFHNWFRNRIHVMFNCSDKVVNRILFRILTVFIITTMTTKTRIMIFISLNIKVVLSSSQTFHTVNINFVNNSLENINSRYSQRVNVFKDFFSCFFTLQSIIKILVNSIHRQVTKMLYITNTRRSTNQVFVNVHIVSSKQENLTMVRIVYTIHNLKNCRILFLEVLFKLIHKENTITIQR